MLVVDEQLLGRDIETVLNDWYLYDLRATLNQNLKQHTGDSNPLNRPVSFAENRLHVVH